MTLFLYPFVKIFGFTPFVLRLVTLVLFWLSMIFTYKLGKSLGGHSDYEHEDMDHDMPIHVKIDN
jgi:4-amino-4-deoxy-L-arabinose transferase-like glycosyltransferase